MYKTGNVFPDAGIDSGTNVLVSGPPMTGKSDVALGILAHGGRNGDGAILVTTKDGGEQVLEEYRGRLADPAPAVGVVDCVSVQQGMSPRRSENVEFVSSPVDMTGIGIKLSEFLQRFHDGGVRRNRILFDSLSTLLMYSNLQTVFRFLHVFTGRVQSAEALGLFVVDSTAHGDKAMSTLRQLFDGEIEVRATDGNRTELRLKGVGPTTEWRTV